MDELSPSGWSMVRLRVTGVSSVNFTEGATSYLVQSFGLHTLFGPGQIGLEFGDSVEAPDSFSELMRSPCHIVGKSLEWDAQFT